MTLTIEQPRHIDKQDYVQVYLADVPGYVEVDLCPPTDHDRAVIAYLKADRALNAADSLVVKRAGRVVATWSKDAAGWWAKDSDTTGLWRQNERGDWRPV